MKPPPLTNVKAGVILVFLLCASSASTLVMVESVNAQESAGVGSPNASLLGPPPPNAWQLRLNSIPPDRNVFRSVNGQKYNILYAKTWQVVSGKVYQQADNILILDNSFGHLTDNGWQSSYYAVTNYPGNPTADTSISVLAMRIGNYDMGGMPIEFYDCGTPYVPPPLTPEQIKAQQEAAKAAAQLKYQKEFLAQSNAIVWLQPQATNGDAGAQCSLGEHYLNGQGCQTNRELAIFWLKKSAAQGNSEASNKLATLKP
jgi:Sel1 repeat